MAKYHLTNKAVDDLTNIWIYTLETWSEKQADKYYDLLILACFELAKNPNLERNYAMINLGVLGYKSGEHIIFYTIIAKNEIEVVRILHGMMDLKSKL
jgi:toxin ParE1/3/4